MSNYVYRRPYSRPAPRRSLLPLVAAPAGPVLLEDDFNDNSIDAAKWTLGSIAFENAAVGVAEANQQVEITPLALTGSPAIYGYKSLNTYDFTGREASIRIAADIDPNTEAWLVVALDADNYIRTWVAGGTLQTRSRVAAGNTNESHGTFSFTTHTYWRIRHDDNSDEIVWEYSPDGGEWLELRRLARPITITSVSVYLSGGTGASVASPGLVKFDDFNLRTPTAFNVVSRTASTSASAAIETAAQFFTTLERSVAVDASAGVTVVGERIVDRSTSLSSTATIETVGESFSVFEASVSASATGIVESSGVAFTVFESAVSISASAMIDASGAFFSVAERVATVDATGLIATAAVRIVERSISITATAEVIANAEFFSVFERTALFDVTVSITVSGQTAQQRQVALSVTADISVSGVAVPPGTVEHERSIGVSATGSIESSAVFFSVAAGAMAINATAEIFTISQREIFRTVVIVSTVTIAVSGSIASAGYERSITISVVGSVGISGSHVAILDTDNTIGVGSETRQVAVNREGRTMQIGAEQKSV